MRLLLFSAAAAVAASPALAAPPSVRLDHLAARVVVISEDRANVTADVRGGRTDLPRTVLRVSGSELTVAGGLSDSQLRQCRSSKGRMKLGLFHSYAIADLPVVTIHAPRDVVIESNGAISGEIGPSRSVDLRQRRCGEWSIGDVGERLALNLSGLGDVRAGSARKADLRVSGMGDVHIRSTSALNAELSGLGDLVVDDASGPVEAELSGMGDIRIRGGHVTTLKLTQSGMGDISFHGVADSLDASSSGMGGIDVAKVTGEVRQRHSGMSHVRIGG